MHPLLYLYAGLNALFFPLRSHIGWKGRDYHEKPAGLLPPLTPRQMEIIHYLKKKYAVHFESSLNTTNALRNYHTLHLLDHMALQFQWEPQKGMRIVDVGSKNFYYAASIHAFFNPSTLTGIELDGFHLYRGFYTNASYAEFYAGPLSHTTYQVMDFKNRHEPVDGIVWFFPFVLKEDVVTWYLPLKAFGPMALFDHARDILSPGGFIFMVNTDACEFAQASDFLSRAGFSQQGRAIHTEGLLPKVITPYVSLWSDPIHTPATSVKIPV